MNQSLRRAAPKISPEGYFGEVQVSAHFFAENSLLRCAPYFSISRWPERQDFAKNAEGARLLLRASSRLPLAVKNGTQVYEF